MKNINSIIKNIVPINLTNINKVKQLSWKISKEERDKYRKKTWKIINKKNK